MAQWQRLREVAGSNLVCTVFARPLVWQTCSVGAFRAVGPRFVLALFGFREPFCHFSCRPTHPAEPGIPSSSFHAASSRGWFGDDLFGGSTEHMFSFPVTTSTPDQWTYLFLLFVVIEF